jgi:hypothetical protein
VDSSRKEDVGYSSIKALPKRTTARSVRASPMSTMPKQVTFDFERPAEVRPAGSARSQSRKVPSVKSLSQYRQLKLGKNAGDTSASVQRAESGEPSALQVESLSQSIIKTQMQNFKPKIPKQPESSAKPSAYEFALTQLPKGKDAASTTKNKNQVKTLL